MPRASPGGADAPVPGVAPVATRTTVQDAVHGQIRHALMIGRFDPGQALTINALAESFGVSHMPVREALKRLAAEKALEIAPSGSARVPPVSRTRLRDLCRARLAVEGLAAELAAPRATPAAVARLRRNLAEHRAMRTADGFAMLAKNQEFHFRTYALSGSEVLVQVAENLWLRFGPYLRMLTARLEGVIASDAGGAFFAHHRALVEALAARDAAAARAAIEADIRATEALILGLEDPALADD